MAVVERELLTKAILAALRTIPGLSAEVGRVPDPPPGQEAPELPYAILYPLDSDGFGGPPTDLEADAALDYQTTTVARTAEHLEFNADWIRRTLLARNSATGAYVTAIAPAGLTVMLREGLGVGGFDSDDPSVLQLPERFRFWVTTS